ncbi:hypothetical protein [Nocardia violaceofusca]|uniref:hypothetical protein n=1 Tax=Nocardia violaceofusca TaxID=941182 RepID=UPI0007A4ED8B|nr:hypothetical protein [Nocardia violaceofusca]
MSVQTSGRFHIEVDDGSPTPPRARRPDGGGGHGLLLINNLSTRWGVGYRDDGKTVWAELDPTSASSS